MLDKKKHIINIAKLENNGELKKLLGEYELHPEAFSLIEKQLNVKAKNLINYAVEDAKKRNDRIIVSSNSRSAIEKLNSIKNSHKKTPLTEGMKMIGNIGLGICLTHLAYVSQNDNISINIIIVFSGIIGALLLGIGLFRK
ncbi:hypothetical protein Q4Q35_09400 [Flavivirga aquimarina]|uniref:DUF2335 domain-containing protein n=1 Tax=Flavivirga aquimarina TaxID=2027862 RepID=A0ABT8WA49_9FLAO|nr:hypothetical protein [Flavivirga aquimarina]MDO5970024.1 hypothetical protein [Flavivirga aquimarina]